MPTSSEGNKIKIRGRSLSQWIYDLGEADDDLRFEAARTLREAAEKHADRLTAAIPALIKVINTPFANGRLEAIQTLAYLGPAARPAVAVLLPVLKEDDPDLRLYAAQALALLGHVDVAMPHLLEVLQGSCDELDRTGVAHETLARLGPAGRPAVPVLVANLKIRPWDVCWFAGLALRGILGPEATPLLMDALREKHADVRKNAANVLGEGGRESAAATGVLSQVLRSDPDPEVRGQAALALGQIGAVQQEATTALEAGLKDADGTVRAKAAAALAALVPSSTLAMTVLGVVLEDPDWRVRFEAVRALTEFAMPHLTPLIPRLLVCLRDHSSGHNIDGFAACTLGHIGAPAVQPLLSTFQDSDLQVQSKTASALGSIGPAANAAIPALLDLVRRVPKHEEAGAPPGHRGIIIVEHGAANAAMIALSRVIGPEDKVAAPSLAGALNWDKPVVRQSAAEGLGRLGANAQPFLPALREACDDSTPEVSQAAAEAVKKIEAEADGLAK